MALMMRSEEHIKYEDGKDIVRVEFDVDTIEELPVPALIGEKKLCMGSTALVIKEGLLVILNGSGAWMDCAGTKIKG
ncbi:MAG: hypothetical protein IJN43_15945 [Ruminococcus sp.]|nr:hypothetical protein [Ruminococcus sp.]